MTVPAPHFHLYAEAAQVAEPTAAGSGRWRFVLRQPGGQTALEAADDESAVSQERLELLAIVRGLEALDQPSRVTLQSCSRQIFRSLQFGLSQWREDDWQWERYGRMTPVKNSDLWQRLDRLLEIHTVQCRPLLLDKADDLKSPPAAIAARPAAQSRRERHGRRIRIDHPQPRESECRNPKFAARRKFPHRSPRTGRLKLLNFLLSSTYRIAHFVLRILTVGKRLTPSKTHG